MRSMRPSSDSETSTSMSSERFRLAVFFVRMWRACEWPRLTLPVAVVRKRFAAHNNSPSSQKSEVRSQENRVRRRTSQV
jgi:hypothetical protein